MSLDSIKRTMPSARNLCAGELMDYQRVFSLVSIYGIRAGISNFDTKEMAAVAIYPYAGSRVLGCLFEIDEDELDAYFEREHRYKRQQVQVAIRSENAKESNAVAYQTCWTVCGQTDEEYRSKIASEEEWHRRIGQYYSGSLWERRDILPMKQYLLDIVLATWNFKGTEWLINFLDDCMLADGTTSIRSHLQRMYSDPSPSYKETMDAECSKELLDAILRRTCWIFGYGSLMSEKSLKTTMPSARNLLPAELLGFQRVFSLVAIYSIKNHLANEETKEMATMAIYPRSGSKVLGCVFEIESSELEAYFEREHPYKRVQAEVTVYEDNHGPHRQLCWTVCEQTTNAEYRALVGSDEEWYRRVGQYYVGLLWDRTDILPTLHYSILVLLAAWNFRGEEWTRNMLDDCVLADRTTSLRAYLTRIFSDTRTKHRGTMLREFPPELLRFILGQNENSLASMDNHERNNCPSRANTADLCEANASHEKTPLHIAVLNNDSSAVRRELEACPSMAGCADIVGNSPFHYACYRNAIDCLRVLLQLCPNAVELLTLRTTAGDNALDFACMYGHYDIVDLLVPKYIADINSADDNGWTSLHNACNKSRPRSADIVRLLLENGADRSLRNSDGLRPLDLTSDQDIRAALEN
jgi:cation transport regulator ChaC